MLNTRRLPLFYCHPSSEGKWNIANEKKKEYRSTYERRRTHPILIRSMEIHEFCVCASIQFTQRNNNNCTTQQQHQFTQLIACNSSCKCFDGSVTFCELLLLFIQWTLSSRIVALNRLIRFQSMNSKNESENCKWPIITITTTEKNSNRIFQCS